MLIKLYTNTNDIVLIEDVTDVCIKTGHREYNPTSPNMFDGFEEYFFDSIYKPNSTEKSDEKFVTREITFAKDGPKRLYLMNKAYVCNDDGKTVHVVDVQQSTVQL